MTPAPRPTPAGQRIVSLDVIRGVALMGILVVNVQSFAMVGAAYMNPTAYGDFTGFNYATWWLTYVFFDSKMMALFSMLFGAGIVLMSQRGDETQRRPYGLHARRMLWLILFGLLHAHLIWFGDILFSYGVCGLVVYFARRWSPKWLLITGLMLLAIPSMLNLGIDQLISSMSPTELAELREGWRPEVAKIESELAIYRGSWWQQMPDRSETAFVFETFLLGILFGWRASGLMLLGMACFKWGVMTGERDRAWLIRLAAACLVPGFALVLTGVWWFHRTNWTLESGMFEATQFNYWGSVLVAVGYLALIPCFVQPKGSWLQDAFASAGRMALSLYLLQSITMTLIFYGHGLGYFGSVSRFHQLLLVIGVACLELLLASIWLKSFRFSPAEWLWRSLTYWKWQPLRK